MAVGTIVNSFAVAFVFSEHYPDRGAGLLATHPAACWLQRLIYAWTDYWSHAQRECASYTMQAQRSVMPVQLKAVPRRTFVAG